MLEKKGFTRMLGLAPRDDKGGTTKFSMREREREHIPEIEFEDTDVRPRVGKNASV